MRQSLGLKFAVLALLIGGSLSYCSIRVDDDYHLALQGDWPEQCIRTTRLKWDDRHFHGWVCAAYDMLRFKSLAEFHETPQLRYFHTVADCLYSAGDIRCFADGLSANNRQQAPWYFPNRH